MKIEINNEDILVAAIVMGILFCIARLLVELLMWWIGGG
jgi:hypothetical protein